MRQVCELVNLRMFRFGMPSPGLNLVKQSCDRLWNFYRMMLRVTELAIDMIHSRIFQTLQVLSKTLRLIRAKQSEYVLRGRSLSRRIDLDADDLYRLCLLLLRGPDFL